MEFNPHVVLYFKDEDGNKHQVFPATDASSVIGLGDKNGDLVDRLTKLEDRVKSLENRVLYH